MAVERFFVFLYPEDHRLRDLLDLAVYILNPDEKWPAHVTLAGPYDRKVSAPRRRSLATKISAFGVGEFRSQYQNTVFIKVGGEGLDSYWHKPDFDNSRMTPHITLYDGDDPDFADALKLALDDARIFFFFHVSRVEVVTSIRGQSSKTLETIVNFDSLAQTSKLTPRDARALPNEERIFLASEALRKAKYYLSVDHGAAK